MTIRAQALVFFALCLLVSIAGLVAGLTGSVHHDPAVVVVLGGVGVIMGGWVLARAWRSWRSGEVEISAHDEVAPVWAHRHLRLVGLLGILSMVATYGVPRIAHELAGTTKTAAGTAAMASCPRPPVPALVRQSVAEIKAAVARSKLGSLIGAGSADMDGLQEPNAAWSDAYPSTEPASDPTLTRADAGYEVRWWSPGHHDHEAADVFLFTSANAAARYVADASSKRCRAAATSYAATRPAGAKALAWVNPEGYLQVDVFFSRARQAYRIVEVPPTDPRVNRARLITMLQHLACQIPDAECSAA